MPYKLDLAGVRGDAFLAAIPLTLGSPLRPLTPTEAQAIKDTWPVIEMQVRLTATDLNAKLSLTASAGQLSIETAYPQPEGTTAPVLLIRASGELCGEVLSGVYDIQFSGPGVGPYTWIAGKFKLSQDVTRDPD